TVREPDGLALSSRNRYLSPADRATALALSAARGGRGGAGVGLPHLGDDPFGVLWQQSDAPRPARGRGRGSGLNRDEIVAVALKVAEAEGPDAVSMRRIAKDLGVGTMSLYHHIPTKDDLLDLMHDSVMGELVIPADELAGDWQEALAQISRRTRAVYERHRWMVSGAWERPQFGPRAFAHVEQSLAIMAGVPRDRAMQMLGVADDYVIGFVSRQVAARQALERAGMDQREFLEALRPYVERLLADRAEEFPHLASVTGDGEDWVQDEDERFEQGLRWLIAGMAQALPSDA
ncbi:MAG TPA: pantoate--beta-alanine ligase, partial [Baekduia sp.]|nr:pantoate--beta-alanine ligase [Baekduia sp.]